MIVIIMDSDYRIMMILMIIGDINNTYMDNLDYLIVLKIGL
jgi:hypothetical protein